VRELDLNSDMGESYGSWPMGDDEAIMPFITSANIACGAHAGDPDVMRKTVRLAKRYGVAIGAHPGYPDLKGFGRRAVPMKPEEVANAVLFQLGALWGVARAEGVDLAHVKPHGALYNIAARDPELARAIAGAVRDFSPSLIFFCLSGSELEAAGLEAGLRIACEGFVDRAYEPNGSLADRGLLGAVYSSVADACAQALSLANGHVRCRNGDILELQVDTLCIHSDTPGASQIAQAVHEALLVNGVSLKSPSGA
jgi:UPF0271 protein